MGVQVTAQLAQLHEVGQASGTRRGDFAAIFTQLGGDPRQAKRAIDRRLAVAGKRFVAPKNAVFVEFQPLIAGDAA